MSIALAAVGLLLGGSTGCQIPPPAPLSGNTFSLGPRGLTFQRDVESLRERRYQHIVRQQLDFSCGAAALATLLRYHYGHDVAEADVVQYMLESGDRERIRVEGFSLLDLQDYARHRGFQTRGFRIEPEVLDRLAIPSITLVNTRGYSHFVVLKGARDGSVFLADPALGQRVLSQEEFLEDWSGVVFFAAARRDDPEPSPLAELEADRPGPLQLVRLLDQIGLRNVVVSSPSEF